MQALYLCIILFGISGQNICKKAYSRKSSGRGIYTFSLLTNLSALLFFLFTSNDLNWDIKLIPYAIFFAVFFGAATIFSTMAIACGPLSLTALISSFSLMIPTFYGLIFLREKAGFCFIPGLILLSVSIFLINKKGEKSAFSLKWLLFVFLAFIGNGMCSVAQKMQQIAFDGAYKSSFMILSLGIVSVIMCVAMIATDRRCIVKYAACGWYLALGCGLLNGAVNLFVMILSGFMDVSLMFPLISVGGIVLTFLVSKFFYREQLTKAQYLGFLFGIGAIVLLNIKGG